MSRRRRRRRKGRGGAPLPQVGGPPLGAVSMPAGEPLSAAPAPRLEPQGSWWSRRWLQALDSFGGLGTFSRNRGQRRDSVLAIHIEPGIVLAQVQSPRPEPYIVRTDVAPLPPEAWDAAIGAMSHKAVFAAKLLAGEMPEEIEEAFAETGATLLPQTAADIPSSCTCGDPNVPCRHIATVHYLLADEFGRDPFLIFKLRGCRKQDLLAALRVKRSGSSEPLPELSAVAAPDASSPQAFWRAGDAVREFAINIAPPMKHAALLRQLGAPPIEGGDAFLDLMSLLYGNVMGSVLEDALKGQRGAAPTRPAPPSSGNPGNGPSPPREGGLA